MKYRTIVADPPWEYRDPFGGFNAAGRGREVRRPLPYQSMTLAEIRAAPVRRLGERNCNLFLWTTNRHLPAALVVVEAWGFTYRQMLVWHKSGANPNTGAVAPTSAEFLIYARDGAAGLTAKWDDSVVTTKRLANSHSSKPEVFLDLIEQVSPGPYLELFARRNRLGWDTWGNECFEHVEVARA